MMKRYGIAVGITSLVLAACSSCSSSGSGTDGGMMMGGACKNVAICTVVPGATVTSSIGLMVANANPDNPTMTGSMTSDTCTYIAMNAGMSAVFTRQCYDSPTIPTADYNTAYMATLKTGGMRTDVTGVGDKAFYQSEPTSTMGVNSVKLIALKGNVYVLLSDVSVATADDAKVKTGLSSIATTLLSQ
jgi:hypothetical protein